MSSHAFKKEFVLPNTLDIAWNGYLYVSLKQYSYPEFLTMKLANEK
jgi:hypothetical protein